jgi:hypothetical protein
MYQLPHIKARIIRLRELTEGLGREVSAWQAQESPLLPAERRQYLDRLQDGLAGLDAAGVVLAGVVKRMEGARPTASTSRYSVKALTAVPAP